MLVVGVYRNSPAVEAGIQGGTQRVRLGNLVLPIGGDIIVAIDDTPVKNERELNLYLEENTQVGQTVKLNIVRDGEEMSVPVTLAERPTND